MEKQKNGSLPDVVVYAGGIFATPSAQLAELERWNALRGWGFTLEDFRVAANAMPRWPDDPAACLVLVPRLANDEETLGALRTFAELTHIMCARVDADRSLVVAYDSAHQLAFGYDGPTPSLTWEVVRLKPPPVCGNTPRCPTIPLLAAGAQHPDWVVAMRQGIMPAAPLPGIVLASDSEPSWHRHLRPWVGEVPGLPSAA